MKKFLLIAAMAVTTTLLSAKTTTDKSTSADDADLTQYVNALIGTQNTMDMSCGNLYPAVARPWGMNFWTAQTGMGRFEYSYTDNHIIGFKQTHQPSPWINDYGCFSIMPGAGRVTLREADRGSWFSHKGEVATPYYYQVYLADSDILAEFTATERAALFRFTFPESDLSYVVVDAFEGGSYVKVEPEKNRIIGYNTYNNGGVPDNYRNYFIVEFDKPFARQITLGDRGFLSERFLEQKAGHAYAGVGFATKKGEQVHVRVASSFISFEQAERNLQELGDDSFETLVQKGKDQWNEALGKIKVEGGSHDQTVTFYSCLYRSLLFPRKFYEIGADGQPVHYSPYNGKVEAGYMFTDTGIWDTFRALFPMLNLLYPSINREIQEGMISAYKEGGFFPEWSSPGHRYDMIGQNSASILVDAYLKGVKVAEPEKIFEGMEQSANNLHPEIFSVGRRGYEFYNRLGYVPVDAYNESAARTLEYAYDDWCIWRMGKALGLPQDRIGVYAKRALNYRNLFDKEHNLMRGRYENGKFETPFDPLRWGGAFTEGNSWHYSWSVFHDPQGLADLMGGREVMAEMLDSVFVIPAALDTEFSGKVSHELREMTVMNMGNYAHGNQPIQHAIYLFDYAGRPWRTQYWVRQAMNRLYRPTPDGYCGDEDTGQTSAWYIFSALGFYPVCPGTDQYILGAPLFKKATLTFENGNVMTVDAPDNSPENIYVDELRLNKEVLTRNYVTHSELQNGGTMTFRMTSTPNTARGTADEDMPYSFSTDPEAE